MSFEPPNSTTKTSSEPVPGPSGLSSFGAGPPGETPVALVPWVVAGAVVLLLVLAFVFAGRAGRNRPALPDHTREQDAYAASLSFYDLQMSESTSLSGGKSTFIDGQVKNTGGETVSAVTLQVAFSNDEALPPQVMTLPLAMVRTREPYVDTQPLADAPLVPGATREFRLIFEGIGANWNQQLPQLRAVRVLTQCNPCR